MSIDRDTIVSRIQKLLALSGSPNEHEAALALQRARELMEKYDVSDLDLAHAGYNVQYVRFPNRSTIEQQYVSMILRDHFHVRVVFGNLTSGECKFVGYPHHIDIARYVNAYLVRVFTKLWSAYRRTSLKRSWNKYKPANKKKVHSAFIRGLYLRVRKQLAPIEPALGEGLVPVQRDEALDSFLKSHFKTTPFSTPSIHNEGALHAGYAAGAGIAIRTAVAEATGEKQLSAPS